MALPILIQATPAQAGDTILTQRYNRLNRTDGPLFRGWWYKAIVVQGLGFGGQFGSQFGVQVLHRHIYLRLSTTPI